VFDSSEQSDMARMLDDHGIDADEPLVVLKREIASSGRTRAWVNGSTVSATLLAEIGRHLVNLHGQHEAQMLLDAESQRRILDIFAGATEVAAQTHAAFDELAAARRDI